ncbi:MAG: type I-C CRISPR-associated protein Cas5c [Sphaerochaetaceae bacterium]|nr:type I-C CRISPR-associated protein Cas5c [Sphaerochaetaceae bacterium]
MEKTKAFCLEVWGDYACFTRPELKVERVSYDVITPSACRAIFESIFWKPAIKWKIKRIEVLNPIKWMNIRRNEVGAVASENTKTIYIEDKRQQRASLILKDVRYRIYGELIYILPQLRENAHVDENPAKYICMFSRRARKGQCFSQPYLGCREFSCFFRLVDPDTLPAVPIKETRDLGIMLYDLDYTDPDNIKPAFFRAKLNDGVIDVPEWDSKEVYR